jgi:hypothetical protein
MIAVLEKGIIMKGGRNGGICKRESYDTRYKISHSMDNKIPV